MNNHEIQTRSRSSAQPNSASQSEIPQQSHEDISVENQLREGTPNSLATNRDDAMIQLLQSLTNKVMSGKRGLTRVNDPETFSGRDRHQFRQFIKQCETVFNARESEFDTERSKISYAGTYLKDIALEWYYDLLEDLDQFETWSQFRDLMQENFGDPNEISTAERQIYQLRMSHSQEIANYITKFRSLLSILKWNDDKQLISLFRRGLPDRILDDLTRMRDHPETLEDLFRICLEIDNRYWEAQAYKSQNRGTHLSPIQNNRQSGNSTWRNGNSSGNSRTFNRNQSSGFQQRNTWATTHLNSDRHLNQSTREERIRSGKCLYCGQAGHTVANCSKARANRSGNQRSNSAFASSSKGPQDSKN